MKDLLKYRKTLCFVKMPSVLTIISMCEKAPSLVTEDSNILGVSRLYVGGYNLSN